MCIETVATQIALRDPELSTDLAYDLAIEYAEERLGLAPMPRRTKPKKAAKKSAKKQAKKKQPVSRAARRS